MKKASNFDLEVFRLVNNRVPKWKAINPLMRFVARFGPFLFLLPLGASYIITPGKQKSKHKEFVAQTLLGTLFVYLVNTPLRRILGRPRPYFSHGRVHRIDPIHHQPSFPSDHASVSFNFARSFRREPLGLRIVAYLLAALISFARVYSGEHYPSDVIAGAAVGYGLETVVEKNWSFFENGEDRLEKAVRSLFR